LSREQRWARFISEVSAAAKQFDALQQLGVDIYEAAKSLPIARTNLADLRRPTCARCTSSNHPQRQRGNIMSEARYWIAINGASCAMASFPMKSPTVKPTPQQLLGFPTLEEAQRAQRICLTEPMKKVRRFLESLAPDVHSGRIVVIQPTNPEPPTHGQTIWMEAGVADLITSNRAVN
jgi:hypothetical protein